MSVEIAIEKLKALPPNRQQEVLDFIEFLQAREQRKLEEIPERERWLWENPQVIASVQRGIEQAKAGHVRLLGSFAEYADLEVED